MAAEPSPFDQFLAWAIDHIKMQVRGGMQAAYEPTSVPAQSHAGSLTERLAQEMHLADAMGPMEKRNLRDVVNIVFLFTAMDWRSVSATTTRLLEYSSWASALVDEVTTQLEDLPGG